MKKTIKIGTMLKLMYGIMLFFVILVGGIGYQIISIANTTGDTLYVAYGKSQGDMGSAFASFESVKCALRNTLYLYSNNKEKQQSAIQTLNEAEEAMYRYLDIAEEEIVDDEILKMLSEARKNLDSYIADVDICLQQVSENKIEDARLHLLNNGVDSANAAEDTISSMITKLDKKAVKEQEKFASVQDIGNLIILIATVASFLVVLFGVSYLLKHIRKPSVQLAEAAMRVAKGEVDVEIPTEISILEMAKLSEAFRDMIENLKQQAKVVRQIAEGDLSAELKAHSEGDAIGTALEKLLQDDNRAFHAIRNATNQISLGSSQIAAASQTLAQGSTEQASAIQQIAASITDIAGKTKDNANQADEVNRIILEAKDNVIAGNDRMKEMVSAMKEINEASENIQKIIKVIDDIAFNTNILALNATVEAARAGEQGKGFAVVAEEVRNLAGRSAEASNQTEEMIEDSIIKVKRGGELAEQTAEALKVVSDIIEQITQLSGDIAKASNDQASATAQIDQALMQVSQVVQTNSATSQECASASEELSGQARGLNQELSKFRLKDVIGNMPSQSLEYAEPNMLEGNMKY